MTIHPIAAIYEAMLDQDPDDDAMRLLYADWLDEHEGKTLAYAQRWMVNNGKRPLRMFQWWWEVTYKITSHTRREAEMLLAEALRELTSPAVSPASSDGS